MGFVAEKWEETSRRLAAQVAPHLGAGEALTGVVYVTRPKLFSAALLAVGVTPSRLILVPVDRRLESAGPPVLVSREEITDAAVWGWGGSVRDFLSASAGNELRFATATEKFRLHVLGGNLLEDTLSGPTQRSGLEALIEFLLSAQR